MANTGFEGERAGRGADRRPGAGGGGGAGKPTRRLVFADPDLPTQASLRRGHSAQGTEDPGGETQPRAWFGADVRLGLAPVGVGPFQ